MEKLLENISRRSSIRVLTQTITPKPALIAFAKVFVPKLNGDLIVIKCEELLSQSVQVSVRLLKRQGSQLSKLTDTLSRAAIFW
jgi:hypothetical protein